MMAALPSKMDEMFSELSAHIDSQRYVISLLSEKCKELLKPRKCGHEIEAYRSSPPKNNDYSEEKQQLEMIEKLLQKATKIRSGYEQVLNKEQKQKTNNENHIQDLQQEHSKPLKKKLAKENRNPGRPHSSDARSFISLSQLNTIHEPSATKPTNSSHQSFKKKPTYLPAHLSAPYKTFAQFKFPTQPNGKAVTARTLSSSHCSTAQPSSKKNPAKRELTLEPLETAQAANFDGCGKVTTNEEDVSGKVEEPQKLDSKDEDHIDPIQESPKDLKDLGKYLKMPPEYSTLLAKNQKLRRKLAKVCAESNGQNCQNEQMKFLDSLQSHMKANEDPSLKDLLATHTMLEHYETLLQLCHSVGLPSFSDESSCKQLHQIKQYLLTIKREFEAHALSAKELIRKGRSDPPNFEHSDNYDLSKSRAADVFLKGSSSPKIVYQDLQQIHEYQKQYEYLVSLRIKKFLFGFLPPFLQHLKSTSADSRKYRQTYRSIYSLVCSNGRTLPSIVGNLNDDLFEVNEC